MYLEYIELLKQYKEADRNFIKAIEQRVKLNSSVLPKSTKFDSLNHSTPVRNPKNDKFLNYTMQIENIDKIINYHRNTRDMLDYELEKKEQGLKTSDDIKDKIYYYKYIKKMSVYKFCKIIGYSPKQIYRYVDEINCKK